MQKIEQALSLLDSYIKSNSHIATYVLEYDREILQQAQKELIALKELLRGVKDE